MFIKLTRFDNRPVWLNASFIVTVEPRRDGNGAVVVPIGDGLDYDVRETPTEVLKMLEGASEATVVPVPVSDCLTKTPADVSPEPEKKNPPPPAPAAPAARAVASAEEGVPPVEESGKKPRKRATRKTAKPAAEKKPRAAKKADEPVAEAPKAEAPVPPAAPFKLELSDDQIARLRKMAPKSVAKIKNTLATQFHIGDVVGTVAALAEKGLYKIDGNHIDWPSEPAEA